MKTMILIMLYPFLLSISYAEESSENIKNESKFNEIKEKIDLIIDHSKSRLPVRLADEDEMLYYEIVNSNNVLQHVMVLYTKNSIDIDLEELEEIQKNSDRIKKNLCVGMTNSYYQYSDLFSEYEIRNRLMILDKEAVYVYAADEFFCQ